MVRLLSTINLAHVLHSITLSVIMSQHEWRSQSRSWKAVPYLVIRYEWYPTFFSFHHNVQRPSTLSVFFFHPNGKSYAFIHTMIGLYLKNLLPPTQSIRWRTKTNCSLQLVKLVFPAGYARLPLVLIGSLRSFHVLWLVLVIALALVLVLVLRHWN